jgi:perosamine synthetase
MDSERNPVGPLIPTFRPHFRHQEIEAAMRALTGGWPALGPAVQQLEAEFAALSTKKYNVAVNSCTTALYLAARCLLHPGDVVGVPAITYISSASAPALHGCRIVFIDVDPVTLLIDPTDLTRKITVEGITAVLPVHLYGNMASGLEDVIRKFKLKVIEDCAHVTSSAYAESIACFSFEAKKVLSCVNGGMLSTNDPEVAARVRQLRFNGLNAGTFSRGPARWDYDVMEHGITGELDDLRASLVLPQLAAREQKRQIRIANIQQFGEAHTADSAVEALPHQAGSSFYMYVVRVRHRAHFMEYMLRQGIRCGVHYKPLYKHSVFSNQPADCPTAEREWLRLVTVPNLSDFSSKERASVCEALKRYNDDHICAGVLEAEAKLHCIPTAGAAHRNSTRSQIDLSRFEPHHD